MCTSIVVNKKKTIVGWNLDILDMEYRVRPAEEGVYIEINDPQEGWLSLFGANARGDFVGMPTCWPFDARSDPKDTEKHPWMGWDRYQAAEAMLRKIGEDFDVKECFGILRAVAQEVCPTVVSMVYDVTERTVYWCENRDWENVRKVTFAYV